MEKTFKTYWGDCLRLGGSREREWLGVRGLLVDIVIALAVGLLTGQSNPWSIAGITLLVALALFGLVWIIFVLFVVPFQEQRRVESDRRKLQDAWEGSPIGVKIPVRIYDDRFVDYSKTPKKIGIWVQNPSKTKNMEHLSVELRRIVWVVGNDEHRLDKTEFVNSSNRYFRTGNVADISGPIPPDRERLIYIGAVEDGEFVLLLEQTERTSQTYYETLVDREINPAPDNNPEYHYRSLFLIELRIDGNIEGRPIEHRCFMMVIRFDKKLTRWEFDHGWRKADLLHPEIAIQTGEFQNGCEDQEPQKEDLP